MQFALVLEVVSRLRYTPVRPSANWWPLFWLDLIPANVKGAGGPSGGGLFRGEKFSRADTYRLVGFHCRIPFLQTRKGVTSDDKGYQLASVRKS